MSEELKKPYMNIDSLDEIKEMIKNLRVLRDMQGSLDEDDEKELARLQGIRNNRVYRQKLKLKKQSVKHGKWQSTTALETPFLAGLSTTET